MTIRLSSFFPSTISFSKTTSVFRLGPWVGSWLAVTWSLGVEEQFYLISPPLVRLLSTQNLKSILIATLILTPMFRAALFLFWAGGRFAMYVWMPCRADSLAMGVLAALLWREGKIQRWYVSYRSQFYLLIAGLALSIPFFIKWLFSPYFSGWGSSVIPGSRCSSSAFFY